MALRVVESLTPIPRDVALPATIRFTVTLRDTSAPPGDPVSHSLTLTLSPDNDLHFTPSGKSVTRKRKVGRDATPIEFVETIDGSPGDVLSFRVTLLDDDGARLTFCLVNLV